MVWLRVVPSDIRLDLLGKSSARAASRPGDALESTLCAAGNFLTIVSEVQLGTKRIGREFANRDGEVLDLYNGLDFGP